MLTESICTKAKAKKNLYRISDNSRNGLCLEITPSGGKYWRLRYRFNAKAKMINLGEYPTVSVKDARDLAVNAKREIENGIDPSPTAKNKALVVERSTVFKAVAMEWFEKFKKTSTPKYAEETLSRLEREIFPYIADKNITEIDAPTVLAILRPIEAKEKIVTMYKVKSHLSQILRYAIACGLIFIDPTRDLTRALQPKKSIPRASIIDPQGAGVLMVKIDNYPYMIVRSAMQLQALTFVRPGELRTAEWPEIDVSAAEWRIPALKMKMKRPHIVPLSRQAIEILEKLRQVTGSGKYLFPSVRTPNRPMSDVTVTAALRSLGYASGEMSGHGFRAMASSLLSERGWSVDAIERQLAHVEGNKVRAAYHRSEHLEERKKMMQGWADYLYSLRQEAAI
jgi:integrase